MRTFLIAITVGLLVACFASAEPATYVLETPGVV